MHQPICIALVTLCLLNNGYIWWHHCTKQRSTGRLISHSHCSKLLCVSIKLEECLISSNDECAVWQMRMLCRPQSDQWIALEKVGRSKLETTAQHRHQWKVFLVGDVMETNSVPDDNVDVLDRSVPASEPTRRFAFRWHIMEALLLESVFFNPKWCKRCKLMSTFSNVEIRCDWQINLQA